MITKEFLLNKKWSFLFIFYILLFNPIFYFWADNLYFEDKCWCWFICLIGSLSLSGISLFLKDKAEKIYLILLFLFSLTPNVIVWSYLFISRTYMMQDLFWVIFDSNPEESKEYFEGFIPWQAILATVVYIAMCLFFLFKSGSSQSLSFKRYKGLLLSCISVLVIIILFQYSVKAISTFDFYKSGIIYLRESRIVKKETELRKHADMKVNCNLNPSENHVFVVIIGESLNRNHMQLYNYFRNTNPLLSTKKDELDVFSDVITCDTHTIGVLKKVLTFANTDHPEYYIEKASVVELFNMAGFETYWISNQEFISKWGGTYGIIAEEAEHVHNLRILEKSDDIVLPYLEASLHDDINKNKIIFIHLMGSHHVYNCRYPREFNYFNHKIDPLPEKSFLTDDKRKTIDEYDNSVRYNDFIVNSVIEQVKAVNKSSYVLYFSDHGEEVFDSHDCSGHAISNVYADQCEIPFILWRSELYKKEMPGISINTTRPYDIGDVIYGISDLSALEYADYDPRLSIFSPQFEVPKRRMVGDEDYDRKILKKK